ncbi:MAG: B12-binding domain-containing radical SAM protein [Desulfomonilaceae bacterium]
MKKILFVQLPPPRFMFEDSGANIPLAAGFLASCIKSQEPLKFETEILGSDVVDVLADAGIIREITQRSPDILAMTLYLWNSQRSLFIATAVKRLLSNVKVIVGGPDVTPDNSWLLRQPAIDIGVFGEGEPQFVSALNEIVSSEKHGPCSLNSCEAEQVIFKPRNKSMKDWDLGQAGYPYVNGIIGASRNGSIFLETVRGCPFKCKYCYYHKAFDSVRSYPMTLVEEVLDFAYLQKNRVNEIYLMDPTFNARKGFRNILKSMASRRRNHDIKIHTELRADLLTDGDVRLFKEAGLVSAEIGLQTVNPDVLKLAGRSGDPERTLAKAASLRKAEVDVTTGIILGLPGDTPEGFSKTLNRLKETQAFSVIQPFTLAILPGSDFRREAGKLRVQYDERPPYYIKSSDTFSSDSMKMCLDEFEETFEVELDYIGAPSLVESDSNVSIKRYGTSYISKWIINLPNRDLVEVSGCIMAQASNPFTIWLKGNDVSGAEKHLIQSLSTFAAHNPHTVLHLVFEFSKIVPPKFLRDILEATANPEIYVNRAFFPLYPEGEVVSPNFIVIAPLPGTAYARNKIIERYSLHATVIWSADFSNTDDFRNAATPMLISGKIPSDPSIRSRLSSDLKEISGTRPEEVMFRHEEAQRWWDSETGGFSKQVKLRENIFVTGKKD